MNDTAINIAIAEACGWKFVRENLLTNGRIVGKPPTSSFHRTVPSYTTDLNAMHEAEDLKIIGHPFDPWCRELYKIVERDSNFPEELTGLTDFLEPFQIAGVLARATARQRAEAFLRTLNLWTS